MKTIFILAFFVTGCFAQKITYLTDEDIAMTAANVFEETGVKLIKETSTDTVGGHIERRDNRTTLVFYEEVSTTTKANIDNKLGIIGSEDGFTAVEAVGWIAFILAAILIIRHNVFFAIPVIIAALIFWKLTSGRKK